MLPRAQSRSSDRFGPGCQGRRSPLPRSDVRPGASPSALRVSPIVRAPPDIVYCHLASPRQARDLRHRELSLVESVWTTEYLLTMQGLVLLKSPPTLRITGVP